eukprot:GHVN01092290.1.p1 GENE.GHVN01092290.1~~GHVN01092290.1.p1  ORF type:complete len:166 (-),score=39.40 GHVN01092290.1:5-502(-)
MLSSNGVVEIHQSPSKKDSTVIALVCNENGLSIKEGQNVKEAKPRHGNMEQGVCVLDVDSQMFKQHEQLIVFPTNAKVVYINIRNKEGDEELTALTTKQLQVKGSSHSSPVVLNFIDAKSIRICEEEDNMATVVPVAVIAPQARSVDVYCTTHSGAMVLSAFDHK